MKQEIQQHTRTSKGIVRKLAYIRIFGILGTITLFGTAWALAKVVWLDALVLPDYKLYASEEIHILSVLAVLAFVLGCLGGLMTLVLFFPFVRRWTRITGIGILRPFDVFCVIPCLLLLWYCSSFLLLYSINGAFTRRGGTTPYCYGEPVFFVYDPLVRLALDVHWYGGNRYASAYMKGE